MAFAGFVVPEVILSLCDNYIVIIYIFMLPVDFGGVVCVCISLVTFQEVFQMQK